MNSQENTYEEGESDETALNLLGSLELLLLLAVLDAGPDAYGVSIQRAAQRRKGGKRVTLGAVYTTLYRLERKDIVRSWPGEPAAKRGGRRKRLFELTRRGQAAVERSLRALQRPPGDLSFVNDVG